MTQDIESVEQRAAQNELSEAFGVEWDTVSNELTGGGLDLPDLSLVTEHDRLSEVFGREVAASENGEVVIKSDSPQTINSLLEDGIYQDKSATPRELIANAITACVRKARHKLEAEGIETNDPGTEAYTEPFRHIAGYTDDGRLVDASVNPAEIIRTAREECGYRPVVEVTYRDDAESGRTLRVKDNGIGMFGRLFADVFNEPARSGVWDAENTSGKLGIGSMSMAAWLPEDGLGTVTTSYAPDHYPNGREVLEEDREGWKFYGRPGVYKILPDKPNPEAGTGSGSEEGSRWSGTIIEIPIAEHLNIYPRDWSERVAKYSPVPVLYNGPEGDEEWGDPDSFPADGDDESIVSISRPGEFTICEHPDFTEKWYLQNVPTDLPRNLKHRTGSSMYNYIVRVENEHGLIIAGPNRGRTLEEVWRNDDLQLHDDDVPLPTPTATRDSFEAEEVYSRFPEYAKKLLVEKEKRMAIEYLSDVETVDDLIEFIREEPETFDFVRRVVRRDSKRVRPRSYARVFSGYYDNGWPTRSAEFSKALIRLRDDVDYAPRSVSGGGSFARRGGRDEKKTQQVIEEHGSNVYMGKTLNKKKCRVLWHNDPDAAIVAVGFKGQHDEPYEDYADLFGWDLIKKVPTPKQADNKVGWEVPPIYQEDCDDDTEQKKITPTSIHDRNVDVTTTSDRDRKHSSYGCALGDLIGRYSEAGPVDHDLVFFPHAAEENLSDHRYVGRIADYANCTKVELDHIRTVRSQLEESEVESNVYTFTEWVDTSDRAELRGLKRTWTPREVGDSEYEGVVLFVDEYHVPFGNNQHSAEEVNIEKFREPEYANVAIQKATEMNSHLEEPNLLYLNGTREEVKAVIPAMKWGGGEGIDTVLVYRGKFGLRCFERIQLGGDPAVNDLRAATPNYNEEWFGYNSIYDFIDRHRGDTDRRAYTGMLSRLLRSAHEAGCPFSELREQTFGVKCGKE